MQILYIAIHFVLMNCEREREKERERIDKVNRLMRRLESSSRDLRSGCKVSNTTLTIRTSRSGRKYVVLSFIDKHHSWETSEIVRWTRLSTSRPFRITSYPGFSGCVYRIHEHQVVTKNNSVYIYEVKERLVG